MLLPARQNAVLRVELQHWMYLNIISKIWLIAVDIVELQHWMYLNTGLFPRFVKFLPCRTTTLDVFKYAKLCGRHHGAHVELQHWMYLNPCLVS